MTDGLVATYLFTAACVIALVCVVAKIRDLDQRAEERRRIHDADAFNAQLAAMTDDEIRRWREWADGQDGAA